MGRLTLKDVAQACGLSRAAVSLVVQDSPRVSEQTKVRVRQVMVDMGYVYDRAAANLRMRRSLTVGLIVTNVRNPYFAELTMAIEQGLRDAGYRLLMGYSYDEMDRQEQLIAAMIEHRTDGVIILPAADSVPQSLEMLRASGPPHVLITREVKGFGADYTGVDNVKAGVLLGEHVAQLGAQSVAFVGGPMRSSARKDRYKGLSRVLRQAGIPLSKQSDHVSPSSPSAGEEVTHALLEGPGQPDAIVAYSDAVAVGVLHALRDYRLRAGRDVAVASFDDVADARYQEPPLTSVATFAEDVGARAAELLLARIAAPARAFESLIIQPALSVRESTKQFKVNGPRRLLEATS
jgi:LacI family transcriptional regulator